MRFLQICILTVFAVALSGVAQQPAAPDQQSEAFCVFEDGNTMKVMYSTATKAGEVRDGRMWEPGGAPLTLFTQSKLNIGGVEVPEGAYSLYFLPKKGKWTAVVSKNVVAKSKYDEKQDLVRAPMETGEAVTPFKKLEIAFAHSAPKQCSLRVYYEKTWAIAEFNEK